MSAKTRQTIHRSLTGARNIETDANGSNEQVLIATYLESNKFMKDSKKELVLIATYLESKKLFIARMNWF